MRANQFYRSRSGVAGTLFVLWLLTCIFAIVVLVLLFDAIPGISVMAMFGFLASLAATSKGSITVCEDRFRVQNFRLLPGFSDREEFNYSEIACIEARPSLIRSTVYIRYKDGSMTRLSMTIDGSAMREALDCIRKHSHIRVEIQGSELFRLAHGGEGKEAVV